VYDELVKQQAEQAYLGGANCAPRRLTQREQLASRKVALTDQLEKVNHALEMLDKNPGFEEVMNAVMQANY